MISSSFILTVIGVYRIFELTIHFVDGFCPVALQNLFACFTLVA